MILNEAIRKSFLPPLWTSFLPLPKLSIVVDPCLKFETHNSNISHSINIDQNLNSLIYMFIFRSVGKVGIFSKSFKMFLGWYRVGKATPKKVPAYVVSVCTIEMRSEQLFYLGIWTLCCILNMLQIFGASGDSFIFNNS